MSNVKWLLFPDTILTALSSKFNFYFLLSEFLYRPDENATSVDLKYVQAIILNFTITK